MASRRKEVVNSTTAFLGNAAAQKAGIFVAKATESGARKPSVALPLHSSRPTYSSRLGAPDGSRPQPSQRSSLLGTAAVNRASVHTARGTSGYVDRYVPNYGPPDRSNLHPTDRSERSYNGNGRGGKYGEVLSRSMYRPGIIRFLHLISNLRF